LNSTGAPVYLVWAQKNMRPRIVQQQQFTTAYIFAAICPEDSKIAKLITPKINTVDCNRKKQRFALF